MRKKQKISHLGCVFAMGILMAPAFAWAQSSSANYKVEESYFGTGGEVDATSASYRSRQSAGSLGVGNTSSANYDAVAGFNTPSDPFLEVEITGATVDFGTLSPSAASYGAAQGGPCSCSFTVRTYLSSEYSVVNGSQPPTNENGETLQEKTATGAPSSDSGVEEFGINLVANTVPGAMGAVPVNNPDNSFADGQAFGDGPGGARDYDDADQYAYGISDVIARSPATAGNQGVGKTAYTISYIAKPSSITEAGQYTMNHHIIVVPTF